MLTVIALLVGLGVGAVLLGCVVVLCSGVVSLAPHLAQDGPLRYLVTEPLGNAYLLAGLALLAWFAVLAFRNDRVGLTRTKRY